MFAWAPLLADEALLKLILLVVFGVIYLVNHLLGANKNATKQAKRAVARRVATPPELGGTNPVASAKQRQQEEVDEFLQRVRRKEAKPETPPAKSKPQRAKPAVRRLSETPLDAEVVERARKKESVAEHVEQHLQTTAFEARAAHMVDDLARADREREAHLKKTFEHKVGRLAAGSQESQPAAQPISVAPANIAAMLRNPQNVRDAIVLNEILQRPADRW